MSTEPLRTGGDWDVLIDRYQNMVYGLALARTGSREDADDVFQEVFLALFRSGKTFREEEHRKAWLLRTTLNRAGDLCRRRRDDACLDAAESVAAEAPDYGPLLSAVRSLPEAYSAVIHLYYYEGYSIKEIARLLALPVPTVGTRLARGRERLREMLKEEELV